MDNYIEIFQNKLTDCYVQKRKVQVISINENDFPLFLSEPLVEGISNSNIYYVVKNSLTETVDLYIDNVFVTTLNL